MAPAWLPCLIAVFAAALASNASVDARAAETDCLPCHRALAERKVVHAAVHMGCKACHSRLDASTVPHKIAAGYAKGLAAEPPQLCEGCHERAPFERRFRHAPAVAALCITCHDPHGTANIGLIRKPGATLCLDCHSDVSRRRHVLADFSGKGHPLGDEPKRTAAQDPLRPGKPFYCASCHEPHSADRAALNRLDSTSTTTFCRKCHET